MSIVESIILGLIQGVTEILPVSSTAHLVLFTKLFGEEPDKAFDVIMNFGSWIAIMIYFYDIWLDIIVGTLNFIKITVYIWLKENNQSDLKNRLPRFNRMNVDYHKNEFYLESKEKAMLSFSLIIATIPALVVAYFFGDFIENKLDTNLVIGSALLVGGVLLFLVDILSKKDLELKNIGFFRSIFIGLGQTLALIPGFSRSGSTITASLFLGLNRKDSALYAFLLGAPIILVATIVKLPEFIEIYQFSLTSILSFVFSIIGTFLTIHLFYNFIQKQSYLIFVGYRIILGFSLIFMSL